MLTADRFLRSGKVRDLYELPDGRLLLVASDRISAFDVVLPTEIPDKGRVLTGLSRFWFAETAGIVPNHLLDTLAIIATPRRRRPRARGAGAARSSMICQPSRSSRSRPSCAATSRAPAGRTTATGHVCGIRLPRGLRESDRLPEPIFTPATKAEQGEHDENIDFDGCRADRPATGSVRPIAGQSRGRRDAVDRPVPAAIGVAARAGILLADTKFEFGLRPGTSELVLIDEALTPDSSRFWDAAIYAAGPATGQLRQAVRARLAGGAAVGQDRTRARRCPTTSWRAPASATSRPSNGSPVPASSATSRRTSSPDEQPPLRRQRHAKARHPRPTGPRGRGQPRPPRDRGRRRGPRRAAGRADASTPPTRRRLEPSSSVWHPSCSRTRSSRRTRSNRSPAHRRRGRGGSPDAGARSASSSSRAATAIATRSHALALAGAEPVALWHEQASLDGVAAVVLPGGFAYGDYLRAGVIARFSPVMRAVAAFAADGGLVLGICNGFQVLAEAGLVPGALLRNRGLRFLGREVPIAAERLDTPFTHALAAAGQPLRMPIAHGEGCYFADDATLDALERDGRVLFRYVDADGRPAAEDDRAANPNGSLRAIAGVLNAGRQRRWADAAPGACRRRRSSARMTAPAIIRSLVESAARAASRRRAVGAASPPDDGRRAHPVESPTSRCTAGSG